MAKRELRVALVGDPSSLNRAFASVDKNAGKMGGAIASAAKVASVALVGGLVVGVKGAIDAFGEAQKVAAQTNVTLKSTSGAAKVTAKEISALATAISRKSGLDDEAIQSGENLLLTFTKIRNETGRGNDIFTRATQTVADFSVTFKKDLAGSAILVGKALNDPIKGTGALSRVGVQFTAQQQKMIKALVASHDVLGAQKIILKELETQTKGAAEAYGNTLPGKIDKAKVAFGNLQEAVGGALAPAFGEAADAAANFITNLTTSDRPAAFFAGIKSRVSDVSDAITGLIDDFKGRRKGGDSLAQALGGTFADAVGSINWGPIGEKISDGFSKGVDFSGKLAPAVASGIGTALGQVDGRKLLSGLLRVVSEAIDALFSPSFWRDNFAAIFSTVTIAIPVAKILKIPGAEFLFRHISRPFFGALSKLGKGLVSRFGNVAEDALTGFLGGLEKFAPRTARVLLGVVTGSGKWLSGIPGKFRGAGTRSVDAITGALGKLAGGVAGQIGKLVGGVIRGLGRLVPSFAREGARMGAELVAGIVRGIKGIPGKVGGAVKKGLSAIGGFLGIGEGIGKLSGGGAPSGSLMGARSSLAPFAAIGGRFGLHVSSGRVGRENKLTSSGNVSYHSTGEAIDETGPAGGMLRYFRYLKKNYGSRLAELIHTPGGVGIKDGHPYRYGGRVAADHYDHVHVALDTGKPGVGDGLGRFSATAYGPPWGGIQGTGVTATGVNLKGSPHIYGVAADPRVIPLGSRVRINPNPFGYGGTFKVFDTGGAIKGRRIDFYDWRGRKSQMAWGTRAVNVSTVDGASSGASGASRDVLEKRLEAQQDRLAGLRRRLADVPKGKKGADRREAIQRQIRSLTESSRLLRRGISDAPTAADIREEKEKAGSRIVNRLARPFFRGREGITALSRFASERERVIAEKDVEFGQAERRFGQTEEDLGTPGGRARRISELGELGKLKRAQLKRQETERRAVVAAVKKYDGLIRKLRGQLKGAKRARGVTAARIRERLRDYEDKRTELAAQARSLGAAIEDTKLDLGDLVKEAGEVAGTADTEAEAGPTVTDRVSDLLSLVDLKERAGTMSAPEAAAQRQAIISAGIQGKFGATTEREQLQLMGDLKEAQGAAVQAMEDNTAAIRALQQEVAANTAFAKSVMAVESASLTRSIADIISGQIAGFGIAGRALMPGTPGVRASY
jgi:3D (Asp-Asp-Asp) domain-containing protein